MTKVKVEPITMSPVNVTSDLNIENFNDLLSEAEYIEKHYKSFIGSAKQCRQLKRRVNKLNRNLNNLRKAKVKPYRDQIKHFKAQVDELRSHISVVTDAMNKQLKIYQQRDVDERREQYQPIWDRYCKEDSLPKSKVPDDVVVRATLSRPKRLKQLATDAKGAKVQMKIQHARVLHGKAVDVDKQTGEIQPLPDMEVHHLTFVGTHLQYAALREFIKKNHIRLTSK